MTRRGLGTLLLVLYSSVVVLAGWPSEVRPGFLDVSHDAAVRGLRLLGMSAGQPLFQTAVSPWKQHGFCLNVRTSGGEQLFPAEGNCQIEGFHWRLPPVHRATHRMLSAAYRESSAEGGPTPSSDVFPAAIGRSFCLQPEERPAEVQAVWTWYYKHYDDGSVLRRNGLLFSYSCEDARLTQVAWMPEDDAVRAFWGEPPWL